MTETRIKIRSILRNQVPEYVKEEFPLILDFLKQYYLSLENQGSPYDLIQNIDKYVKVDNIANLNNSTVLTSDVLFVDNVINVESTAGFPDSYGLLQIGSEVITYTSKTSTTFNDCVRGFSGITSLNEQSNTDDLVFTTSESQNHSVSDEVTNLSILFLKSFFVKLKAQVSPGFEDRQFYSELNKSLFIKQSKDFYQSKGTKNSFEILFRSLFGKDVEVIKPQDYLIQPSDADYRITNDIVVEKISGEVENLLNQTIYQDETSEFSLSRGTVTNVEKIQRGNKEYYILSLDYGYSRDIDVNGSILGSFSIHPKTKLITEISDLDPSVGNFLASSTSLDVDSTVGFPRSGNLLVYLSNGTTVNIKYTDKTLTQFLNCSGIDQELTSGVEIKSDAYAYGYSSSNREIVKFFITGVLSNINVTANISNLKSGYPVKIKTLGNNITSYKFNNWFFNISTKYLIKSITAQNNTTYFIDLYDDHIFNIGDMAVLLLSNGDKINCEVAYTGEGKKVTVKSGTTFSTNLVRNIQKVISKVDFLNYPELSVYESNVQNVYVDNTDNSLYVAAPSFPTYYDQKLLSDDRSVKISGTFSGTTLNIQNHPFYSGDAVYYRSGGDSNNLGIVDGFYFVYVVDSSNIKLSKSRPDIYNQFFVEVHGSVTNNTLEIASFVDSFTLEKKNVESQKLIRKISEPKEITSPLETESGKIGIFVNGVELLNYKSKDSIFYGPITNIDVTSFGNNYDVINPPQVIVSDDVGAGVTAYASVKGSLESINIVDGGFDYVDNPIITISGGNGFGAEAYANLVTFEHFASFNASPKSGAVNESESTISFVDYHKFRDHEQVIYDPEGSDVVGGLFTNSIYYVSVQDDYSIKLHKNETDSILGINTISLSNVGSNIQRFKSTSKKKKIGSITISEKGLNYQSKKITTNISGINTSLNYINIQNHGYNSGEIIEYNYTENPVVGLSSTSKYIVTKVDGDNFKLSTVGVGTFAADYYFKLNQYVDMKSIGSGIHMFDHESISVNVVGTIGVSTVSSQNYSAILQPIFRGSVESIHVQEGGSNYGSEIINYDKQPLLTFNSGSGAILSPVVSNGRIVDVIILSPGSGYNSPPDIVVNGSGFGELLTPVLSNGTISSVIVVSGGTGFDQNSTSIDVISAGSGAKGNVRIKEWKINLIERLLESNQIRNDDGIIDNSLSEFGLQYSHAYAPRNLRSSVFATGFKDGIFTLEPDLKIFNGIEETSVLHSPILGWAYDGNPIYGPYGYSTTTGGIVTKMKSSYKVRLNSNRPSTNLYPLGFFVEDYHYDPEIGNLDEHNGRFCVTPEYPNGIYAYFLTIDDSISSDGSFKNYKKPIFPYVIGNTYKSSPIDFNFKKSSNQIEIDINKLQWMRNTTPYSLTNSYSDYDYLSNPNEVKEQVSVIKSVSLGEIDNIGILTGGKNYQVGDKIIFENPKSFGKLPISRVSWIGGKEISSLSNQNSKIENVEFYPSSLSNSFVAISSVPHSFNNGDFVTFSSTYEQQKFSNISFRKNILYSNTGIGSTNASGYVTYFSVSGNLKENAIKENDIYQLGNEQIKILNVDPLSSRIRVLRDQNGTVGGATTYPVGFALTEIPRKFYLNFSVDNEYDFNLNREFYFNPSESLGIGTTSGPGITSTISFSNPGVGITQITIPTRSIYIPNHNLETGDELVYSPNGGTQVSVSTDGVFSYQLNEDSIVYATRISNDLIGISSYRVGLGTTGSYVAIGSTTTELLYFTGVGVGDTHSFVTNYANILKGTVDRNLVTVSTSSTHGMFANDIVNVSVVSGLTTNVVLKYDDYNRRVVINPIEFTATDVNVSQNTITIINHKLYTGQKIIHTSTFPCGGLENEKIYYAVVVDENKIKLSNNFFASKNVDVVDITTSSIGTILPINPNIKVTRNSTIEFDVSDSSLSFIKNSVLQSSFNLDFYTDSNFQNKFEFSNPKLGNIKRISRVGIDTDAKVIVRFDENTPSQLYYKITPLNLSQNIESKKGVVVDSEINDFNSISLVDSEFSGEKNIVSVGQTYFQYFIENNPEKSYYDSTSTTLLNYLTNSLSAYGPIADISINYVGSNLESTPKVSSIDTEIGYDAILEPLSLNIGKYTKSKIEDIGFDYSSDYSVRPTAKFPSILKVRPQTSLEFVGVSSVGTGYLISPKLILIDGFTNKVVDDVDLDLDLKNRQVRIIKNTKGIYNTPPRIIPINNSNGVSISSVRYIDSSKDVVVTLGSSFSDIEDYPFNIGDKVLIENVSVGVGSTAKGYNSSKYGYNLFTIVNTDPNIGGIGGTVSFNISDYISSGENPGKFDSANSAGRIIPEKYFPIFDVTLKTNEFYKGEIVTSNNLDGSVVDWDKSNEILVVSSNNDFSANSTIEAITSKSKGVIETVISSFEGDYIIDSSSIVEKGWSKETGILNNSFQRMHDNDYYQYFSYSLRSEVPLQNWENAVSNLNHTAGFKKFSDLIIESSIVESGISTSQDNGLFESISDYSSVIDLNCTNDFDLASEILLQIDDQTKSNEILFETRVLQDYIESIGNRVLSIDDFSDEFVSQTRPTNFSSVHSFDLGKKFIKYFTLTRDKTFTTQREFNIITLVQDEYLGFVNQYGKVYTSYDMGTFDFGILGTEGNLLFYPTIFRPRSYDVINVSHNITELTAGTASQSFGDISFVESTTVQIPQGTSTASTIVGIASTYRCSKILVSTSSSDSSYHELNEVMVIHDGTNIFVSDYGQINNVSLTSGSSAGIGTIDAYYSGGDIIVDLTPYSTTTKDYTVNCIVTSIASTLSTTTGSFTLDHGIIDSHYVAISSSPTPGITTISFYNQDYDSSYCIVSVEDTTNNKYEVFEVTIIDDDSLVYTNQFGILQTDSSLGSIGSTISSLDGKVSLTYAPIPDIDVEVRTLQTSIGFLGIGNTVADIDLITSSIDSGNGYYYGTDIDIKRSFTLNHKNRPIFERYFDGSDSNIIDISESTIKIPENFFTNGEKVSYVYTGLGSSQAIGIATTTISGISTDKMPSEVYIVKVDDFNVQVAASSSDALKTIPNILELSSVGIGTSHLFISQNQNSKAIISIDNVIQSPIVSTGITHHISKYVSNLDSLITISGISSVYSGRLIKINNEILRIDTVGFGSTNVLQVQRGWMGTGIQTHGVGSVATIVNGDYNIVRNNINFITAPYGLTPIASVTNPPDSRDFIGIQTHSTFHGRVFMRSGITNSNNSSYDSNYIFDNISTNFDGFTNTFNLKSDNSNVSGISTGNAVVLINSVFQLPERGNIVGDYDLSENIGITSITFTGNISSTTYDTNTAQIPRGGSLLSVGSTYGLGYQPLISAGGTSIVSIAGTISSISIGNSGSGYREGIQSVINVGVTTYSTGKVNIEFIGTAAVVNGSVVSIAITNPGIGYTSSNPPIVVFDSPLSYYNIPLVYSSDSISGVGSAAKVSVVVGQGSSIIDFKIENSGYGYKVGEILTVSIGGTVGIPTSLSTPFREFQITVDNIFSDSFSAWTIGDLQVLDPIDDLFDGSRRFFPLKIDGEQTTIRSRAGSKIEVKYCLLIFINDILQIPEESYIFNGGSIIRFKEAPKNGDTSKIIFYKGTSDVDTRFVDILETIKPGDKVTLKSDDIRFRQDQRTVTNIISSDSIFTNIYSGPGISPDVDLLRPVKWCRQTEDMFIDGNEVSKDRILYEPLILPATNIIQNVGPSSSTIFVENIKTFFDSENEYTTGSLPNKKILIISQDSIVSASATAVVSSSGTISSIQITDGGFGYYTTPEVLIGNPVGLGTTFRATASATISVGGTVSSIGVSSAGIGYTTTNPPVVLIEQPKVTREICENVTYEGDFGIITGIGSTSVGVASTGITFDLFIPQDSFLRDLNINSVGTAVTGLSGIQTGYYFVVYNSNIGSGLTSLYQDGSTLSIGSSFVDNVYEVASVSIAQTSAIGIGITNVARVTVSVSNYNGLSGFGFSGFYGEYSWGKITLVNRQNPKSFNFYNDGISGIQTSALIQRFNPLKYRNYNT